jgi:hypothetical protein
MTERTNRKELTPAGRLAATGRHDVIGDPIAQASIVTRSVFRRAAGDSIELRPVEYTMLVLAHENPAAPPRAWRAHSRCRPPISRCGSTSCSAAA